MEALSPEMILNRLLLRACAAVTFFRALKTLYARACIRFRATSCRGVFVPVEIRVLTLRAARENIFNKFCPALAFAAQCRYFQAGQIDQNLVTPINGRGIQVKRINTQTHFLRKGT